MFRFKLEVALETGIINFVEDLSQAFRVILVGAWQGDHRIVAVGACDLLR